MTAPASGDAVLTRFKAALDRLYGPRLARAVLFGSRARGDSGPESDYDVAVFLRDLNDRWREMDRLADLGTEFLIDGEAAVHALPYPIDAWNDRTPLMHEIRKDGIDL